MKALECHHVAWLSCHPHRAEEWLREALSDGFDVHHLDGDHLNNASENLILVEHTDHMMIHGMVRGGGERVLGRLSRKKTSKPRRSKTKGVRVSRKEVALRQRVERLERELASQASSSSHVRPAKELGPEWLQAQRRIVG